MSFLGKIGGALKKVAGFTPVGMAANALSGHKPSLGTIAGGMLGGIPGAIIGHNAPKMGKVGGAVAGGLLGGIPGAVAGGGLGSLMARIRSQKAGTPQPGLPSAPPPASMSDAVGGLASPPPGVSALMQRVKQQQVPEAMY